MVPADEYLLSRLHKAVSLGVTYRANVDSRARQTFVAKLVCKADFLNASFIGLKSCGLIFA